MWSQLHSGFSTNKTATGFFFIACRLRLKYTFLSSWVLNHFLRQQPFIFPENIAITSSVSCQSQLWASETLQDHSGLDLQLAVLVEYAWHIFIISGQAGNPLCFVAYEAHCHDLWGFPTGHLPISCCLPPWSLSVISIKVLMSHHAFQFCCSWGPESAREVGMCFSFAVCSSPDWSGESTFIFLVLRHYSILSWALICTEFGSTQISDFKIIFHSRLLDFKLLSLFSSCTQSCLGLLMTKLQMHTGCPRQVSSLGLGRAFLLVKGPPSPCGDWTHSLLCGWGSGWGDEAPGTMEH